MIVAGLVFRIVSQFAIMVFTAWTDQGEVMGLRRTDVAGVEGVQFHPESILTEAGHDLLRNFLGLAAGGTA